MPYSEKQLEEIHKLEGVARALLIKEGSYQERLELITTQPVGVRAEGHMKKEYQQKTTLGGTRE